MEEQAALVVDEVLTEEQATLGNNDFFSEYVGRWNRLISTTNWEKGRIICEWREALQKSDAPAVSFTDDAWSRRVGGVTPQHVGRLRRVYERFNQVFDQYPGLYWSHFQTACEWSDAEMYLQGAVENHWSISQMRDQRWEAMGGSPESKPRDEDIVNGELDEDVAVEEDILPPTISESFAEVHDAGDLPNDEPESAPFDTDDLSENVSMASDVPSAPQVRPFESLPSLPSDINEAFELFKLAILAHKITGWSDFAQDDVLSVLESLRQLVLAPAE
jgi:hypothetical protein